jgi:hypothetical protein
VLKALNLDVEMRAISTLFHISLSVGNPMVTVAMVTVALVSVSLYANFCSSSFSLVQAVGG